MGRSSLKHDLRAPPAGFAGHLPVNGEELGFAGHLPMNGEEFGVFSFVAIMVV